MEKLKTPFWEALNSSIGYCHPTKGYTSTQLSKLFGDEIYKNIFIWDCFIFPYLTDNQKSSMTLMTTKISRSLILTNNLHSRVVSKFENDFTNEQLRCIIHAIISYQKSPKKSYYNVRRYTHIFIDNEVEEIYFLGNLKYFKAQISRISLLEFEIFDNLIIQLLEENDSKYIFKLVKTFNNE